MGQKCVVACSYLELHPNYVGSVSYYSLLVECLAKVISIL